MAKTELRAGATIDIPTLDEIDNAVQKHTRKIANAMIPHVKYRKIMFSVAADGSGNLSVNTNLGPEPGFLWDVNRLVMINATTNVGAIATYLNTSNPGDLVFPSVNCPGVVPITRAEQFVIQPGSYIYLVGSALGANATIMVTGQVKEIPINSVDHLSF